MSEDLDALAESARNRGLKLVRSRVRTPGKRRFGKAGLADKAGKAVFGMDGKGPTARPEEIEAYLRTLGVADWTASLGVKEMPRKKRKPVPAAVTEPEPQSEPAAKPRKAEAKPEPGPVLKVRAAKPGDAAALVPLIALLGHPADETGVAKRLKLLAKADETPLVATLDKLVVGLCGIHRMTVVHRPAPVGRITILVVAEDAQGQGIGRLLVERAEMLLRQAGCGLIEITSNDRLTRAHAFYRHLGYQRTGMRFAKALETP